MQIPWKGPESFVRRMVSCPKERRVYVYVCVYARVHTCMHVYTYMCGGGAYRAAFDNKKTVVQLMKGAPQSWGRGPESCPCWAVSDIGGMTSICFGQTPWDTALPTLCSLHVRLLSLLFSAPVSSLSQLPSKASAHLP